MPRSNAHGKNTFLGELGRGFSARLVLPVMGR